MKFFIILLLIFSAHVSEANDLLKTLVEISSGSNDVAGVTRVQKLLSDKLKEMKFQTELIPSLDKKLGPLLVGTMKGKKSNYITFVIHADTVFERSSGFIEYKESSDKKIAYGPGVIDDKGGIVVLLSALKQYLANKPISKYSLRVVSSPGEEVGTPEFVPKFIKFSRDSILVLGFEPCLDDGSIIDSRRGNRWYDIKVIGREAHAGRSHQTGINACWELSKKLDAISSLTDYSKDLTVSVGRIEGGKDKYNIVCGEASAKLDVRFSDRDVRDSFQKKLESIIKKPFVSAAADSKPTVSTFDIVDDTEPYSVRPESINKIKMFLNLIKKHEGREITSQKSGGAADTNHFSRPGLSIIDGLGACGGKMHTQEEYIELSTLETRAKVIADFLEQN